ncbi:MAG: dTMP kinase, partial [Verrucomicrobiota bacterium]
MIRPFDGGLLVAIEGIDGAGKTSIAALLAQWCGERGIGCLISKEPTSNHWGMKLRESAQSGRLPVEEELKLLELDRRDHIERSIGPALAEGGIVILDRYYWSTAAYQGSRGLDYQKIVADMESFAPIPDLVLFLDVDVDAGLQRIRMRGDQPNDFEKKSSLNEARDIFVKLAEESDIAIKIDASGHLKETLRQAMGAFRARA